MDHVTRVAVFSALWRAFALLAVLLSGCAAPAVDPTVYVYGDSIVGATNYKAGIGFAAQVADGYNTDGAGHGCTWAHENFTDVQADIVVVAFGTNDPKPSGGNLTSEASATCLVNLALRFSRTGHTVVLAATHPVVAYCRNDYDTSVETQRVRLAALLAAADRTGIRVWHRYDAIDAVPNNGELDSADPTLLYDCTHPNQAGHDRLAASLRLFLKEMNS